MRRAGLSKRDRVWIDGYFAGLESGRVEGAARILVMLVEGLERMIENSGFNFETKVPKLVPIL